jgi:hypothetical protein
MDQEIELMKTHIDRERDQLTGNLREIESRFKKAADVREKFNQNPLLGLGVAFAGGFLLSVAVGGSRSSSSGESSPRPARTAATLSRMTSTLDNIFEAFIGLGAAKLESLIADAVPGFHEQYKKFDVNRPAGMPGYESSPDRSAFR